MGPGNPNAGGRDVPRVEIIRAEGEPDGLVEERRPEEKRFQPADLGGTEPFLENQPVFFSQDAEGGFLAVFFDPVCELGQELFGRGGQPWIGRMKSPGRQLRPDGAEEFRVNPGQVRQQPEDAVELEPGDRIGRPGHRFPVGDHPPAE